MFFSTSAIKVFWQYVAVLKNCSGFSQKKAIKKRTSTTKLNPLDWAYSIWQMHAMQVHSISISL